jgi:hypothetical protein
MDDVSVVDCVVVLLLLDVDFLNTLQLPIVLIAIIITIITKNARFIDAFFDE